MISSSRSLLHRPSGRRIRLFGLRPSTRTPSRSAIYQANRFSNTELPAQVDLREFMTPVEDQAAFNSCTANAVAGAYEYLATRQLGHSGDVSRLFVYFNARALDGIEGDQGSSITSAIESLHRYGTCAETTWPYMERHLNRRPSRKAYDEASQFVTEDALQLSPDLFAMKHCLAEGYPFLFGLTLFESFDRATRNGRIPLPSRHDTSRREHGSHAMLAVGYSDKSRAFVIRNSWGPDWGDHGYCYIPYEYLANEEYCGDLWSIRAVTDLDFSEGTWHQDDQGFFDPEDESFEGLESWDDWDLEDDPGHETPDDEGGMLSNIFTFFFGHEATESFEDVADPFDQGDAPRFWDEDPNWEQENWGDESPGEDLGGDDGWFEETEEGAWENDEGEYLGDEDDSW